MPRTPSLRPFLPFYVVIFFGFVGYSPMITVFTPMLLGSRSTMLAAVAAAPGRCLSLGCYVTGTGATSGVHAAGGR